MEDEKKVPQEKVLLDNIGKIAYTLDRAYMPRLEKDYGVLYFDEKYNQRISKNTTSSEKAGKKESGVRPLSYASNIRAVRVKKWLFDKDLEPGECFKNVLSTFSDGDHTIALVVKRTPNNTEMYFVVKNDGAGRNNESSDNLELLDATIHGNFPGTDTEKIKKEDELQKIFSNQETIEIDGKMVDKVQSVSLFANSPSQYSEKYISQGIDKLLNGMVPMTEKESYTVVFLAESLSQDDAREIISGYEDIASAIYPFMQHQFQMGSSEVETNGEMSSISNGTSTTDSVFKTHSINVGVNGGLNKSHTDSTTTDRRGATRAGATAVGALVGGVAGFFVGGPAGVVAGATTGAKVGGTAGDALSALQKVKQSSDSYGSNIGGHFGYGYSWGTSKAITTSKTYTDGKSHSIAIGESEATTYTYKSYMVANLLERIEKTITRINTSQATGLWKYSTYVLAYDSTTSKSVANYLKGITQGKESYIEPSVVQEWSNVEGNGTCPFKEIKKYISLFTHPVFITVDEEGNNAMCVTPTSYVGTDELSNVIAFPKKSLQGIPVVAGVSFGREPYSLSKLSRDIPMGKAYHLHKEIDNQSIDISIEELSKHTFITGSTGSGKSNTIYWMLDQLVAKNKKFLVIEPAKGDYKKIIGQNELVTTYGTNPLHDDAALLKINPFSFPIEEIHILEHLDRLVEIFNVCWPMYAAMPAILKDAIEQAYVAAGWDLTESYNRFGQPLFPTFADVMFHVRKVLNESDYSSDNKGDYIGSLVTRLKSLTNGINGVIFSADEISGEDLFDKNVIIDLSRVGSTETKSFIMGLLILKLQEYRMQNSKPDSELNHVTVLEEAHNILKRTSSGQSAEGANLLGKAVEMISNSIAEMRTYGEGFIIADQAPGLLDLAVIRNTNTKIIMRLPDYEDRVLVGKAAGLNDDQIDELSKLEMGVASITQSGWIEPVLCKIFNFKEKREKLIASNKKKSYKKCHMGPKKADKELMDLLMTKEIYRKCDRTDIDTIKATIIASSLDSSIKCEFLDYIDADGLNAINELRKLVYDFFNASEAFYKSKDISSDLHSWLEGVVSNLTPTIDVYGKKSINLVLALIVYEHAMRNSEYVPQLKRFTEEYKMNGQVI